MAGKPTLESSKVKELRSGFSKSGIHGSDDPCEEPPDYGSIEEPFKVAAVSRPRSDEIGTIPVI